LGEFKIRRWDKRPRHDSTRPGEVDFGQWHKDNLRSNLYCMDVDKIEYRFDAEDRVRIVGLYELIRWDWPHDLASIPDKLSPHQGKLRLMGRLGQLLSEGENRPVPAFFVWHRPDLSEFLVSRVEDWTAEPRRAAYLSDKHLGSLIEGLPDWGWSNTVPDSTVIESPLNQPQLSACNFCGYPQPGPGSCHFCGGPVP
jgi:hypothetical protein